MFEIVKSPDLIAVSLPHYFPELYNWKQCLFMDKSPDELADQATELRSEAQKYDNSSLVLAHAHYLDYVALQLASMFDRNASFNDYIHHMKLEAWFLARQQQLHDYFEFNAE